MKVRPDFLQMGEKADINVVGVPMRCPWGVLVSSKGRELVWEAPVDEVGGTGVG
jgi:hypothetical protein